MTNVHLTETAEDLPESPLVPGWVGFSPIEVDVLKGMELFSDSGAFTIS